jgi:CRISPR-associated endonuclease/helicase Cas3
MSPIIHRLVKVPKFFAHTLEGEPPEKWQQLEEHLIDVAKLAASFAASFGSESLGYLAGLWHDLGKYQVEFQQRLLGSQVSVEHSGAGAAWAFKKKRELGIPLAFVIAGHHAGLPNYAESDVGLPAPLQERLRENVPTIEKAFCVIPEEITGRPAVRECCFSKFRYGIPAAAPPQRKGSKAPCHIMDL